MSDHQIDELQIVISADSKDADAKLKQLIDFLDKLDNAGKGGDNSTIKALQEELDKTKEQLVEIEKALDKQGEKKSANFGVGSQTQFGEIEKGLSGVADKAEQTAGQVSKAFSFDDAKKLAGTLSQTEIAQQKLNTAIKEYQTLLNQGAGADKLDKQKLKINQLQNSYDRLVQQQERNSERQAQAVEKEEQARIRAVEKELQYQEKLAQKKDLLLHKERMAELKSSKATYKDTARGYKGATKDYKSAEKYWKEVEKEGRKAEAVFRAVEKAQNDMMRNASVSPNMARNLVGTTSKADTLRMKLDEATETVRRLMVEGTGGSKLASAIENVKKAQSDLNTELRRPYLEQQEKRMATLKKIASGTATVMKKLGSATATVGRGIGKTIGKPLLTPFSQVSKAVRGVNAEVSRLFKNLKRVALYRALREMIRMVTEGIKTGVSNAYQWALAMEEAFGTGKESATRFRSSMDSLATSSLYLKNSLGAMAMPLLNILAPAVDYMIDKFVALLNIINKLIATVSGASTWTRALKYPKAFGEALDDASGSAGKLKDELITILGIDEINPMADAKDPSGRGGGASGLADDYGAMFEEVALESDKIDDILSALFDPFKQAWESKGKGVMEAFDNALEGIKASAIAVGTSFWDVWTNGTGQQTIEHLLGILEGVLNTIGNIGKAFAKGWNTDNLGTRIIQNLWDSLNSILDMWEKITQSISGWDFDFTGIFGGLEVLTRGIKEGIDAISESFSTVFTERAEGTFNTVLGILEGIERVLGNIALQFAKGWNTNNLGTKIFENIWKIADNILNTIKDIVDMTVEWASGLNFEPILTAFDNLTRAIDPLVDLIGDGLKWAWENVLLPLGKWTIEKGLPELLNSLAEAIRFLKEILEKAQPFLDSLWNDFLKPIATWTGITALQDLKDLRETLGDINDLMDGEISFGTFFDNLTKKLVEKVMGLVPYMKVIDALMHGNISEAMRILKTVNITDSSAETPSSVDLSSEYGITINATAQIDEIVDNTGGKKKDLTGFTAFLKGMDFEDSFNFSIGGLIALFKEWKKDTTFKETVDGLIAGFKGWVLESTFGKIVTGLLAGFTGNPHKEKGFSNILGGLTAEVTGKPKTGSGFSNIIDTVANFFGLQTNWNSKISTYGKAPMWGAVANFRGLQTNWNSGISTSGKAPMWGAVANFRGLKTNWNSGIQTSGKSPMWNSVANFVKKATGWATGTTTWGSTANFTSKSTGWGDGTTTWSSTANFTSKTVASNFNNTIDTVARITDTVGTPTINANIKANKIIGKNGISYELNAKGGSYYNGSWHTIPQYASGGLPNHGSMFIAGEAGAELVGHIGGHTEVLNQSQMASALAEGMAPQAHLLQQLVAIGEQILAEQGDRNVVVSTSAIAEGFQRMNRREGRTVVPVGV